MPVLKDAFSNYDEFEKQPYQTKFQVANNFFDTNMVDDEFKALAPVERAQIRQNYIDQEIGSSLTSADTRVSGFYRKMMQGFSNTADIPGQALEFINALTAQGNMNETWLDDAAKWWHNSVAEKPYWEGKVQPTGKYARAIDWRNPSEFFDPKRIGGGVLEFGPYTLLTMGAYGLGGKIAGAVGAKALGLATIMAAEGGQVAESIAQAEKETGEDIPYWQQAGVTAMVGTANTILESILPESLTRSIKYGTRNRMRAIIANGLLNAGKEGITEAAQELTQLIAEVGYTDEMPDWYGRIMSSFHGGLSIGGIFGGAKGATARMQTPIEERVSEIPIGTTPGTKTHQIIASAITADTLDKYVAANVDYVSNPSSDKRLEVYDYETSLIQAWRAEHPDDVTGNDLGKMLTGAKIDPVPVINRIRGTVVPLGTSMEPVKIPKRVDDISTLTLKTPRTDGTYYYASVTVDKKAARPAVNRALTAFSFLRNKYNDVHDKVTEIKILPAEPKAWIQAAVDNGYLANASGEPIKSDLISSFDSDWINTGLGKNPSSALAELVDFGSLHKKSGVLIQKPDGTFKMLLRADNKKGITSADFAYVVGHELQHAVQYAGGEIPTAIETAPEKRVELEGRAQVAGLEAQNLFNQANAIHPGLVFSRSNPNADKIGHEAILRYRALAMLGHNFSDISIAQGQLFVEDPLEPEAGLQRVNGYIDKDTRALVVSGDAAPWVLGHEATHVAILGLGKENSMVKQGLDMFGGDEEALSDAVGRYFENRIQDQTLTQKLGQWLKDLWAEFVRTVGVTQSEEQLMRSFNKRITDEAMFAVPEQIAELQDRRSILTRLTQDWQDEYNRLRGEGEGANLSGSLANQALDKSLYYQEQVDEMDEILKAVGKPRYKMSKLTTTLRFYDNLAKVKGNVNLTQLPLKNLKIEEATFVKSVAQDLMEAGEKIVTPERLKQAIEAAKIPISVDVEMYEVDKELDSAVRAIMNRHGGPEYEAKAKQVASVLRDRPKDITGYTVPGYNTKTHNRWLFTTPIDFGETAHGTDITATNAIGWAEVAEKEGDPKTLMVFEVQPSDAVKDAATGLQEVLLRETVKDKQAVVNLAPHVNSLMYRGILQEAARKGFEKVLFPVGDTVAQIEGTEAPVELYNRMAERMEKEFKGQTERVTTISGEYSETDINKVIRREGIKHQWLQVSLTPETAEKPILMFSKRPPNIAVDVSPEGNIGIESKMDEDTVAKIADRYNRLGLRDVERYKLNDREQELASVVVPITYKGKDNITVIGWYGGPNNETPLDSTMLERAVTAFKYIQNKAPRFAGTIARIELIPTAALWKARTGSYQYRGLFYSNGNTALLKVGPRQGTLQYLTLMTHEIAHAADFRNAQSYWYKREQRTKERFPQRERYMERPGEKFAYSIEDAIEHDFELRAPESIKFSKRSQQQMWKDKLAIFDDDVAKNRDYIITLSHNQAEANHALDKWTPEKAIDDFYRGAFSTASKDALKRGETWRSRLVAYSERPDIMFSKRRPFWDYARPVSKQEQEEAPKRKRTYGPSTRWGFTGYAETKAAQNIINALPEDKRKLMDLIARTKANPDDPRTYTELSDWAEVKREGWKIGMDFNKVSELLDMMRAGKALTRAEVMGLKVGLLKRSEATITRMALMKDENGTFTNLRDRMLMDYTQALNQLNISAGQTTKALDLHHDQDHLDAMYAGLQAAYGGEMPAGIREKVLEKIAKGDMEGAGDVIDNWKAVSQSKLTKTKNIFFNVMFEGLLSGAANVKNLGSNTLFLETNVGLRGIRAGVESLLSSKWLQTFIPHMKGHEQQTYFPEVWAMQKELMSAKTRRRAWAVAKETWKTGKHPSLIKNVGGKEEYLLPPELRHPWDESLDLATKWEIEMGTMINPWKAIGMGEKGSRLLTTFSRSLIMVDAFFKTMASDADMQAQIVREMQRTGKLYKDIEITPAMKEAAHNFMNKVTFMDKPGAIAQSAYSMRGFWNRLGLPGKAIIPFVNTLANILQRGIEFTPGLGFVTGVQDIRSEMSRKTLANEKIKEQTGIAQPKVRLADNEALTDMIVNQTAGVMLTLVLMSILHDDDGEERITGAPPKDARERVSFYATKQPYSIRVGDQWLSYRNIEPLNIILSNVISIRDALREADNPETHKDIGEKILASASALIENLLQSSYMEGFMNLIKDGSINPAAIGQIPAEFIPYSSMMRAIHKTYEVYQTGEYGITDNRKFTAAMANTLWWLPEEITHLKRTPRINALGEEIKIHVGKGGVIDGMKLWFPIGVMEAYTDPVEEELASLRMYVGLPGKEMTIRGQKIDLPDDFYREYSLLYGKYTKETLLKAIARQQYQAFPVDRKAEYLKKAIEPARRRARLVARRQYVQAYLQR